MASKCCMHFRHAAASRQIYIRIILYMFGVYLLYSLYRLVHTILQWELTVDIMSVDASRARNSQMKTIEKEKKSSQQHRWLQQ